jgi:hypothetical protein
MAKALNSNEFSTSLKAGAKFSPNFQVGVGIREDKKGSSTPVQKKVKAA